MRGYNDFLRNLFPDDPALADTIAAASNPPVPTPQPQPPPIDYGAVISFINGQPPPLNNAPPFIGPPNVPPPPTPETDGGGGGFFGSIGNAIGGVGSAVGGAIGSGVGAMANTAGNVGNAVIDAVPTSFGEAGSLAMDAIGLLDVPRQQVVTDVGTNIYKAAVNGDDEIDVSNWNLIANIYTNIPGKNAWDDWLNTEGNRERVIDAYENGYDANGDGNPDFTGGRAVWELMMSDTGTFGRIIGDIAFDPLTVLGVGAGQKALKGGASAVTKAGQTLRTADDASLATRVVGTGIEGIGRGAQAIEYAANDALGDILFGGARLAGGAVADVARVADNAISGGRGGAALDNTVGRAWRYATAPSSITQTARANRATEEALHQLSRTDQDLLLDPQWRQALAEENARRTGGVFDDPIPSTADIDPLAPPAGSGAEFGPGAWGARLPGTEDLGYLAPTEKGSRLVDFFGRDLYQRDPEAFARFTQDYVDATRTHKQTVDTIDNVRGQMLADGADEAKLLPAKTLASAQHVVRELVPLVRKYDGDDTLYRYMNNPISDPALNVLRDDAGKVLNRAEVTATRPNVRTIVEQAVFGPSDQAATDARYWMRRQGGQWGKTADEVKKLRAELRGPDSVKGRGKAATDELVNESQAADLLPDDHPDVQAWRDRRWMAEQEANSLREMGQTIPDDLQAILDEPRPIASVDAAANAPLDPYEGVRFSDARTPAQQQALGELVQAREVTGMQPTAPSMPVGVTGQQRQPWTTGNALDEMVRIGELTAEDADILRQVVDVTVGEGKDAVTRQRSIIDIYAGMIKDGLDPADAYRKTYGMVKKENPDLFANWGKLGKAMRAYDKMLSYWRETLMFNIAGGPRGIITDTIGDTIQLTMKGDTTALNTAGGLRGVSNAWNVMRGKSDEAFATTRTGQTIDRLGIVEPAKFTNVDDMLGREQVERGRDMTVQKMIRKITRSDRVATGVAAANPTQSKIIRDLRSSLDLSRRFSVYGNHMARNLADENRAFFREILERNNTEGIDDFALIQKLTGQPTEPLVGGLDDWLARLPAAEFSPRDVRKAAMEVGYSEREASRMANSWRKHVTKLNREALKDSENKLFTYEATRADEVMKRVFLFHFWLTRATPQYLEAAVKNPEMAVNFYRAANGLDRAAEAGNWPRTAKGILKMWSSPGGYSLFLNPIATVSTMVLFREQAIQDGDESLFEKIVNNGPGMFSPLLAGAATLVGALDEGSLDPTMTYTVRNTIGAIAQWAVANGYLDAVGIEPHLLGTPYQSAINQGWSWAREGMNKASFGLVSKLDAQNPQATTEAMIQANIADKVRAEFDLPFDLPIDQWSPEAQNAYVEAMFAFQYGRSDNDIANEALREYANGQMLRRGFGMLVPGGIQTRSDVRDDVMVRAAAGDEQAMQERNLYNAGSPLATSLAVGQANYQAVGSEAPQIGVSAPNDAVTIGKRAHDTYNAIRFDPPAQTYIGGRAYSRSELMALSEADRKMLADQWLQESGQEQYRSAFLNARDEVLAQPINQPFGDYLQWRNNAYDLGADQVMQASPVLQQMYRNMNDRDTLTQEQLAARLFSPQGYALTQGQQGNVYDPINLDAPFDPTQQNPIDAMIGASRGDSFGSSTPKSREAKLADSIRDYQANVSIFNQHLQMVTGGPWTLDQIEQANPMLRSAILGKISAAGLRVPSMPRDVEYYQMWSQAQPPGSDKSFAAFYRWMDSFANAGQPIPVSP